MYVTGTFSDTSVRIQHKCYFCTVFSCPARSTKSEGGGHESRITVLAIVYLSLPTADLARMAGPLMM